MFAPVQFSPCFSPHCSIGNFVPKWMEEQMSFEVQFMYCSLLSYRQSGPIQKQGADQQCSPFSVLLLAVPETRSEENQFHPILVFEGRVPQCHPIGCSFTLVGWPHKENWRPYCICIVTRGGLALGRAGPRPSGFPPGFAFGKSLRAALPALGKPRATDQQERRKLIAILTGWLRVTRQNLKN